MNEPTEPGLGLIAMQEMTVSRAPFTILEEQTAGTLPEKLFYRAIPELSARDILPESGFDQSKSRDS